MFNPPFFPIFITTIHNNTTVYYVPFPFHPSFVFFLSSSSCLHVSFVCLTFLSYFRLSSDSHFDCVITVLLTHSNKRSFRFHFNGTIEIFERKDRHFSVEWIVYWSLDHVWISACKFYYITILHSMPFSLI